MRMTVLVPTYRRPRDLLRCVEAVAAQTRPPDELLVVCRADDLATQEVLVDGADRIPVQKVEVDMPGQVHALNAGLARATGEVVAITDDDAAPRCDWLARIEAHFAADPGLGGLGGRDWIHIGDAVEEGVRPLVGRVQWFGRVIGNHHLGAGAARTVHFLKGANMSYRREAIGSTTFDYGLRGRGAQIHNDLAFSLAVGRRGWRLLYDPLVAVDHYPAERPGDYQRQEFHSSVVEDDAYNFVCALRRGLPPLHFGMAMAWRFLVGTAAVPGVLGLARLLLRNDPHALPRWHAARLGLVKALRESAGSVSGRPRPQPGG